MPPRETLARVRRIFTDAAPRYDLLNRLLSLGRDRSWRRLAAARAKFPPGEPILDLGAGTGDMALAVARRDSSIRLVCLDPCPALTALGRRKPGLARARWLIGEGGALPFRSGSFGGAVAAFSLRNVTDPSRAIAELRRVVRPGGRVAVVELVRPEGGICTALYRLQLERVAPAAGRLLGSDPEAYAYLPASINAFYSARGLYEALERSGFAVIESRELMFRTVAVCIAGGGG